MFKKKEKYNIFTNVGNKKHLWPKWLEEPNKKIARKYREENK